MVVEKNFKYLFEMSADIAKLQVERPLLAELFAPQIKSFYDNNRASFNEADGVIRKLLNEHVEVDENGKHLSHPNQTVSNWLFKSCRNAVEYNEAYTELISRPVKIHI